MTLSKAEGTGTGPEIDPAPIMALKVLELEQLCPFPAWSQANTSLPCRGLVLSCKNVTYMESETLQRVQVVVCVPGVLSTWSQPEMLGERGAVFKTLASQGGGTGRLPGPHVARLVSWQTSVG